MLSEQILEVKNLKKYFDVGPRQVLKAVDDISFSIKRGSTLGLVGESGCGKTTVGRTLVSLYEADGGEIIFDGKDIMSANKKELKQLTRRMQMIYQDPYASLNPFFTVGEIISEGLIIHKIGANKKERMEIVYELLELVGLHREHANRFPHEFSGGQRQRVGIARSLAVEPEFIVCDEAISALDVSIQAQIVNLLVDFQDKMGLTYLFIAHDLSMVRYISDRTAVMYLGKLVELGDGDEVYSHPVHPYTQGLLSAVPIADPRRERSHKVQLLEGEVQSPINPKPGCRFFKRCPKATGICSEVTPELIDVGSGHMAACHNID
ncbi:MAG: ABC transporter ATP-binding protein [Clostridiales bacterium]|jgi:oligopeptide transport system ATP-binding protein|nr:ABC transporter ATP-binding protein [Clostridiales bacterium]